MSTAPKVEMSQVLPPSFSTQPTLRHGYPNLGTPGALSPTSEDSKSIFATTPGDELPSSAGAPPNANKWSRLRARMLDSGRVHGQALSTPGAKQNLRPPLDWSSPGNFATSLKNRLRELFTLRLLLCILGGQWVSFCLTATSITTTELSNNGWRMPTTQSTFLYAALFFVYTPYTVYSYGPRAWGKMILTDGWKYFILAAVDVEANYVVVKAYQYTDLLSAMLLDAWATPCCMIFAFFLTRARYHWTQIAGVVVCMIGLACLVISDHNTDKNYPAMNKVLGDILMLVGATLYGLSNALEERFVRARPLYEVVGQLGMWGLFINGIQSGALEHKDMLASQWTTRNIGLVIAFTAAMFNLYTIAPLLFRYASSPFYNLSILTSDFYGLLFGLFLYKFSPYWLYFLAYVFVLAGLIVYFSVAPVEAQGSDVQGRGKKARTQGTDGEVERERDQEQV